ncbi:MAG: VOC family protein [Acidimicrobiia bacterium]
MASETPDAALGLVLDCADAAALAPFWAAALGYVTVGQMDNVVVLVPDGRPGPHLILQEVPEPKAAKNRMHVDLHPADIEAEAARLVGLGARRLEAEPRRAYGANWIVMADPEGNEFCVCDGGG